MLFLLFQNVEKRLPSELSGGMKKRVALARAIISDADEEKKSDDREVVMYDEPTAGLDPIASTVVEDLIRSLHVKSINPATREPGTIASYIVVTHQHSTIRRAVDRLVLEAAFKLYPRNVVPDLEGWPGIVVLEATDCATYFLSGSPDDVMQK